MKTAISIPDDLFRTAEEFARRLGLSRSELYATALRSYLEQNRGGDITARLNDVYGRESSAIEPGLVRAQSRLLSQDEW